MHDCVAHLFDRPVLDEDGLLDNRTFTRDRGWVIDLHILLHAPGRDGLYLATCDIPGPCGADAEAFRYHPTTALAAVLDNLAAALRHRFPRRHGRAPIDSCAHPGDSPYPIRDIRESNAFGARWECDGWTWHAGPTCAAALVFDRLPSP